MVPLCFTERYAPFSDWPEDWLRPALEEDPEGEQAWAARCTRLREEAQHQLACQGKLTGKPIQGEICTEPGSCHLSAIRSRDGSYLRAIHRHWKQGRPAQKEGAKSGSKMGSLPRVARQTHFFAEFMLLGHLSRVGLKNSASFPCAAGKEAHPQQRSDHQLAMGDKIAAGRTEKDAAMYARLMRAAAPHVLPCLFVRCRLTGLASWSESTARAHPRQEDLAD
jgi:hypothetical protein